MKISPLAPGQHVQESTPSDGRAAIERATKVLTQAAAPQAPQVPLNQSQAHPVSNPSAVSPEEMTAISSTSNQKMQMSEQDLANNPPQNDSIEAKEPEAPKAAKEEPLSSQYAQLARKEKAIRAKALEIREKEADIARREAELASKSTPKASEGPSLKDRAQTDPLGVMQELGLTYEQLTELLLNQDPQQRQYKAEMDTLKAEIKALREENHNTRKQDQEQAYKNAVAQIKTDVSTMVKTSEDYEMIRETGSIDDVVELIEVTFKEEGRVMPIDEAAQLVEEHLLEEALKLTKYKKIQSRLHSLKPESPAPQKQDPKSQPQVTQAKTLTNSMSTNRPLTNKERALLAFEGKLKSG